MGEKEGQKARGARIVELCFNSRDLRAARRSRCIPCAPRRLWEIAVVSCFGGMFPLKRIACIVLTSLLKVRFR